MISTGVTYEQLRSLNVLLGAPQQATVQTTPATSTVAVNSKNPETLEQIQRLKDALSLINPNGKRGLGSIDIDDETPTNYWLGVVWAIRSLNWACGEHIAREWSRPGHTYKDKDFDDAWKGYQSGHANPVGIGSLYRLAYYFETKSFGPLVFVQDQTTLLPAPTAPTALPALPNPTRYKLLDSDDLRALPPVTWCVKGVFPATGLAAIFGPSSSGKSFLALDLAAAIAEGAPWFGFRTTKTPIVYMALEGEGGIKLRFAAWEKEKGRPLPLKVVLQPFQFAEQHDVNDLAATVPQGAVVIVDTLNRSAPTADENSSRDMGIILEAAKRLQTLTCGLVVLIHHTGKDTSKGLRGHSSLFAALDGSIEVGRNGDRRTWSIAKAKDGVDGQGGSFKLKRHVLGMDADGDELSSCTVERDYGLLFQVLEPTGRAQKAALRTIKAAIRQSVVTNKAGCGLQIHCMKVDDAVSTLAETLSTVELSKRSNRARVIIQGLAQGGYLQSRLDGDEGWLWI